MSWISLVITFTLVDNLVLDRVLGICPCVAAPRGAAGVGVMTAFFMSSAAILAWAIEQLILAPLGLEFLQALAFTAAIAAAAWLVESLAKRLAPALLRAAGFSVPRAALNSAVLGIALIVTRERIGAGESLVVGLSAGLGVALALALMSAIRARLDVERVPRALQGVPASLLSAGLLALAFMAFDGAFLERLLKAWS